MVKTLILDYWADLDLAPGALRRELERTERVINLRMKGAFKAYAGRAEVDDLLEQHRAIADLIYCMEIESRMQGDEYRLFAVLTRMISRKRCPRFVG